jgi:peptide/nickel transport system substrate-binding protein
MGSGPFRFTEYQVGQSISGIRNPDYYHRGLPYLDGFTGIFADKQSIRVSAIRSDRAAIARSREKPGTGEHLARSRSARPTLGAEDLFKRGNA